MENYFYKCPVCGFVHLVPAYWVSFDPPPRMEFSHINEQGQDCNTQLELIEE